MYRYYSRKTILNIKGGSQGLPSMIKSTYTYPHFLF